MTMSSDPLFQSEDPRIKDDIVRIILQYLHDEGFHASRLTLHDEAKVKAKEFEEQQNTIRRMRKAIFEGDWAEVDSLLSKSFIRNQKSFLYAIYKQQFLEYIEHHETQKAFSFLVKRLKPLEHLQTTPHEFRDMAYLLTARSIQEAPSFRNWEGINASREKLLEQFQNMIKFDSATDMQSDFIPRNRLLTLLNQSVCHQIERNRHKPVHSAKVTTLLQDFESFVVPNTCYRTFTNHTGNVKCAEWVGVGDEKIISGSSDNRVLIWNAETAQQVGALEGHHGRIWELSGNRTGTFCVTGSADGFMKLWNLHDDKLNCVSSLTAHETHGDIYTVKFHPADQHAVAAGYDKTIRLFDLSKEIEIKSFLGHALSISKCIFNPYGNLVISGSKDSTIKFWDITSGLCVKTITSHLGEVTSVDISANGLNLLSSSKDNSIRLWDIRMMRPVRRFKGHQNTSANWIRAGFAGPGLVASGSEDGLVYLWNLETGELVQTLSGHCGVVYGAMWSSKQSMVVSYSDDMTLKSWYFHE